MASNKKKNLIKNKKTFSASAKSVYSQSVLVQVTLMKHFEWLDTWNKRYQLKLENKPFIFG